jgi:rhamnosyltransferase
MKTSLIVTCLNEIDNIEKLLKSIVNQTLKPNEMIVVDAGSTDGTLEVIKKYAKRYKWIKKIVTKGATRGKGRNIGIKNSKNDIIVTADAGCFLDKNWLKNITKPFKEDVDVVVGFYKPYYENEFEFYEGFLMSPKEIDIPARISSRSLAFRKKCWKKTGGYEENVDVGEDTLFHLKILQKNFKIKFVKNAVVFWIMPKNIKEFFKKFFKYGAGYWQTIKFKEMRKFFWFLLASYSFGILFLISLFYNINLTMFLLLLVFLFHLYHGFRGFLKIHKYKTLFYLPILSFIKNFAFVLGFTLKKFMKK